MSLTPLSVDVAGKLSQPHRMIGWRRTCPPVLLLLLAWSCCPLVLAAQTKASGVGNPAIQQHGAVGKLDAHNPRVGMSFEAGSGGIGVTRAYFETRAPTGGPFKVRVGFQYAESGERDQLVPDSNWIDGIAVETEVNGAGIQAVDFNPPIALPGEVPVFLVIESAEDSPAGSLSVVLGNSQRSIESREEAGGAHAIPRYRPDDTIDGSFGIYAAEIGKGWSGPLNWMPYVPVFLLVDAAGQPFGNPMHPIRSMSIRSWKDVVVQEFELPKSASPYEARELVLMARFIDPENNAFDLDVLVEDGDRAETIAEAVLHFPEATPQKQIAGEFYTVTFDQPFTLEPGRAYRLVLRPHVDFPGETCFFMARGIPPHWADGAPEANLIKDQSVSRGCLVSHDGGATFQHPNHEWANILYFFR